MAAFGIADEGPGLGPFVELGRGIEAQPNGGDPAICEMIGDRPFGLRVIGGDWWAEALVDPAGVRVLAKDVAGLEALLAEESDRLVGSTRRSRSAETGTARSRAFRQRARNPQSSCRDIRDGVS